MKKPKEKNEILEAIRNLFSEASKNKSKGRHYIQLAKKIAMRGTVKIPKELKQKYCHKCLFPFDSKSSRIRIKKGMRIIQCLKCGNYNRIKIK